MNTAEMLAIVNSCTYKPGWRVTMGVDTRPYVQVEVSTLSDASMSSLTGVRDPWKSGKRYLSQYMCRQEIVGAVFGVIKAAEEHEMREWFRYRGASIYNPHLDPDALVEVARFGKNFNTRENAMSMEES